MPLESGPERYTLGAGATQLFVGPRVGDGEIGRTSPPCNPRLLRSVILLQIAKDRTRQPRLLAPLRINLFTHRDPRAWLDNPFRSGHKGL